MTTEMNSQQIYKSVLNSAIQKALRKNLPLILEDAIQYLEEHDWQVKERKNRSKKPPPPLSSTEGSIKMNTPKILMESGDLTCISKTLKKFTGGFTTDEYSKSN